MYAGSPKSYTPAAYLEALSRSLQLQNDKAKQSRRETEDILAEIKACKAAMIQLATNYDRDLGFLEARTRHCFKKLKHDETGSLELLGKTLEEIRIVRKLIQSDAERLREQGLRLVPADYEFSDCEKVVIVGSTSAWEGAEGSIVLDDCSTNDICVAIRIAPTEPEQSIMVPRHQIAIWDYDSIYKVSEEDFRSSGSRPSREASKRRLVSVLASITSSHDKKSGISNMAKADESSSFTSSRQRKAAAKKRRRK
jgi:hypothetical protein